MQHTSQTFPAHKQWDSTIVFIPMCPRAWFGGCVLTGTTFSGPQKDTDTHCPPPCNVHTLLYLLKPEPVRMLIRLRPLHMVPALYVCFVSHLVVCWTILNFWVCLIGPPIEAVPCIWSSSSPLECFLFLLRPLKMGGIRLWMVFKMSSHFWSQCSGVIVVSVVPTHNSLQNQFDSFYFAFCYDCWDVSWCFHAVIQHRWKTLLLTSNCQLSVHLFVCDTALCSPKCLFLTVLNFVCYL